jgi:hypothetical protein
MTTTLFDYTQQGSFGSRIINSNFLFAQSFNSDSVYNIENIKLLLYAAEDPQYVPVTINLYDSSLNNIIATSNSTNVGSRGIYSFTFANTVQIQASTYYIVLNKVDGVNLEWYVDEYDDISFVSKRSIDGGSNWTNILSKLLFGVFVSVPSSNPAPGSTGAPFGITSGNVSSDILSKVNASTFQFTDPQTGHTQESAVYFTDSVSDLALGTLSASGPQVKVIQSPTNYKYIFSSYSDATKNSYGFNNKTAAFVLKVIDGSGVIQNSISPALNLELYLDVSGGLIVNLDISGTPAGVGTLQGLDQPTQKWKYTTTLTNGSGSVTATVSGSASSAGSDPHITTIFGKRYDLHPSTRKTYTLYKSNDMKVSSHFTGLKSGVYYDKVMIDLPNKQQVKVDFNKKTIKGKSDQVSVAKENPNDIKYKNITSDKSVGKYFAPKTMTKLSVAGKNPVDLFVDFDTRYVHFRFPDTMPPPSEMSGLIVEPVTRLD